MAFATDYHAILDQMMAIKPEAYVRNRNFADGDVSRLSPYISRGVLSTKQVLNYLIEKEYDLQRIEKFVQELAWRDYWQQVWVEKREAINTDLKQPQADVKNNELATAIINTRTGITAIDNGINSLYETGYMHNHMRMYIAAIAANMAKSHWLNPAKWMYYHLLDGDWASNALSWQWVAGSNANKKYVANQENINKYFYSKQKGTFLDVAYSDFETMSIPDILRDTESISLSTEFPETERLHVDSALPTLIYNYYNLDPLWRKEEKVNRVLLIEPAVFEKYPISEKCMVFMLDLSKNIEGIQVYVGSYESLLSTYGLDKIIFKEHPLNEYQGEEDARDWMFEVKGYYKSFFAFWKKCKKELKQL